MTKPKKYSLSYWVRRDGDDITSQTRCGIAQMVEDQAAGKDIPIVFEGTPLELANELYKEWGKRNNRCNQWFPGFYPTPLEVGRAMVQELDIPPNGTVLDPGCGFGNLTVAVKELRPDAQPLTAEIGYFQRRIAKVVLGYEPDISDFLDCQTVPVPDAVIANPPFGRIFGHGDIAMDFLNKIADVCETGTHAAIILPSNYWGKTRPKARCQTLERFRVLGRNDLDGETFAPLTCVNTSVYYVVVEDGRGTKVHAEAPVVYDEKPATYTPPDNSPEGDPAVDLDNVLCEICGHPLSDHKMTSGKSKINGHAERHEVCLVKGCTAHELWNVHREETLRELAQART